MPKNYLVRGGYDSRKHYTFQDIIKDNMIGGNAGNILYLHGVLNVLLREGDTFTLTGYQYHFTDAEAAKINETYDAFIIPLADAFRDTFRERLVGLTDLIRRLRIPCIVVGTGLRAPYNYHSSMTFPFDDAVRDFIAAVLAHSTMVGLRGELTGEYLKGLGFQPERDFTVIGCPSLYMYGNTIRTRPLVEQPQNMAYSCNELQDASITKAVLGVLKRAAHCSHMIQTRDVLKSLYYPKHGRGNSNAAGAMGTQKFFCNIAAWQKFMSECDLMVGPRFHGTVAAVLAGTPALIVPTDARTRELAAYHCLPTAPWERLQAGDDLYDYIQDADLGAFTREQPKKLAHYRGFLERNGLENALTDGSDLSRGHSYYERQMCILEEPGTVIPFADCSGGEKLKRLNTVPYLAANKLKRKIEQLLY